MDFLYLTYQKNIYIYWKNRFKVCSYFGNLHAFSSGSVRFILRVLRFFSRVQGASCFGLRFRFYRKSKRHLSGTHAKSWITTWRGTGGDREKKGGEVYGKRENKEKKIPNIAQYFAIEKMQRGGSQQIQGSSIYSLPGLKDMGSGKFKPPSPSPSPLQSEEKVNSMKSRKSLSTRKQIDCYVPKYRRANCSWPKRKHCLRLNGGMWRIYTR